MENPIRRAFNISGADRLAALVNKARMAYLKNKPKPLHIPQSVWDEFIRYWNTDEFKKKSMANQKNRLGDTNGKAPALHIGGSMRTSTQKRKLVRSHFLFINFHKNVIHILSSIVYWNILSI